MHLRKKIGAIIRIIPVIILLLPAASPAFEIAIFKSKNLAQYNDAVNGFKVNCQAKFDEFDMEENPERGVQIVKMIKDTKPDLIFTVGINAALTATREIKDIPIVFAMVLNPGNYDLSGKNVTGVALEVPVKTQLYTLKSIHPKVSKVGVIYNPKNTQDLIKEAQKSAKELDLILITAKVDAPQDAPRAFRAFSGGIDAYWMIPDPTVVTQEAFKMILDFTYKNNVPFIAFSKSFVDAGALVSLSPNYASIGQQACQVAQKIMQGGKVAEIPVQSPKGLELTFNINTAKKLGLENIATQAIVFAASEGYKISVSQ
jgi:putative ABC transport system substrate-binding protein